MSEEERGKKHSHDAEEVQEILSVVSGTIPALIKGVIGSFFSEEAGRNMGRGAAAYYSELKAAGIPDEEALKMTKDYVGLLTNIGQFIKEATQKGKGEIGTWTIQKQVQEKTGEKTAEGE